MCMNSWERVSESGLQTAAFTVLHALFRGRQVTNSAQVTMIKWIYCCAGDSFESTGGDIKSVPSVGQSVSEER